MLVSEAEERKAGRLSNHTPPVTRVSIPLEHRQLDPVERRAEPRTPDHGRDIQSTLVLDDRQTVHDIDRSSDTAECRELQVCGCDADEGVAGKQSAVHEAPTDSSVNG